MRSETHAAKKFRGKNKKEDVVINASEDVSEDIFSQFVGAARDVADENKTGFIIPVDEHEPLLQVQKFVPMPQEICEVLGTEGFPCGLICEVYGPPDCGIHPIRVQPGARRPGKKGGAAC